MNENQEVELLKYSDVIKAIHQHLWVESEKAKYDKGLSWAAEDWMKRFAPIWVRKGEKVAVNRIISKLPVESKPKRRRAKSYI